MKAKQNISKKGKRLESSEVEPPKQIVSLPPGRQVLDVDRAPLDLAGQPIEGDQVIFEA